jgi:hypothetical protein
MSKIQYPSFPECCRKLLVHLESEGRAGARNCEKGHAVSVEYAREVEAEAVRKAAAAAARNPTG